MQIPVHVVDDLHTVSLLQDVSEGASPLRGIGRFLIQPIHFLIAVQQQRLWVFFLGDQPKELKHGFAFSTWSIIGVSHFWGSWRGLDENWGRIRPIHQPGLQEMAGMIEEQTRIDALGKIHNEGKSVFLHRGGHRTVAQNPVLLSPFTLFAVVEHHMHVLAYDAHPRADLKATYVPLDELLAQSDIISLHCPLTAETHHLIDREHIKEMKDGAIIINTSRGALIDSQALLEALRSKKLGGAGLDVYEEEKNLFYNDNSTQIIEDETLALLISMVRVL